MEQQLRLETILEQSFKDREKRFLRYGLDNRELYIDMARRISPRRYDHIEVFNRLAFSILSANAHFEDSCKALRAVREFFPSETLLKSFNMIGRKAVYLQDLREGTAKNVDSYLKRENETWQAYRLRLRETTSGLGLTKASFAACLLYPLQADVCCIDTWMLKVFHPGKRAITNLQRYLLIEDRVRSYAFRLDLSVFLTQWLIWDFLRGRIEDHAILRGE